VCAFEFEESSFAFEAVGVAVESAAGVEDAVAGDDDGDGVAGVGEADGAGGAGRSEKAGEFAVGGGASEGDAAEFVPDAVLEGGAAWGDGEAVEGGGVAVVEVGVEVVLDVVEEVVARAVGKVVGDRVKVDEAKGAQGGSGSVGLMSRREHGAERRVDRSGGERACVHGSSVRPAVVDASDVRSSRSMELTTLRQFVAIARAGHVTRAARALGVAQPTLSASLRKLEAELGADLMHRTSKGVVLTEAGEAFLQHAEAALAQADAGVEAVRELAGLRRGVIRVGGGATAVGYLLPEPIRDFRAAHPDIQLYLREAASREVARAVRRGELDLGIVTLPLDADDASELMIVGERDDELRLATPPGHRLASRESFRWADLEGEPIIGFEAGSSIRRVIDTAAADAGVTLNVVMELRAIDIMIRMVSVGVGLAIVSDLALESPAGERSPVRALRSPDGRLVRRLALIRRSDFTPSSAVAAFEGLLRPRLRRPKGV